MRARRNHQASRESSDIIFFKHFLTHIYHIGAHSCILYEQRKISKKGTRKAPLATNRLGDRLQRLQTILASFGMSWAVLNLNREKNNLNFSLGSYANRLWCKDKITANASEEK